MVCPSVKIAGSMRSIGAIAVVLVSLASAACTSDAPPKAESPVPAALEPWLDEVRNAPVANPPVVLFSYRYRDQDVVYVPPTCCDIPSVVYDSKGQIICHPSGGFTGMGDGKCPDFTDTATDCAVLWRDPRGKKTADDLCAARDNARAPLQ